ncbi:hypothetical protein FOBRF1_001677 [Fusarium oxysporum]
MAIGTMTVGIVPIGLAGHWDKDRVVGSQPRASMIPFPSPIPLPKISQSTDSADYESELAVVSGVSPRDLIEHVL